MQVEFNEFGIAGVHMAVCRLKGNERPLINPNPGHRMILDLLEGRASLKSDPRFTRLTINSSALGVTWDIGIPLTDHQRKVYRKLISVKPGKTTTYGELAKAVGSSPRAVGRAMARNPFPFIVPCHRVVAAGGMIGGWTPIAGIDLKRALLEYEAGGH